MIGYYLSSNNEMCYSAKTQTFSPTKHTLKLLYSIGFFLYYQFGLCFFKNNDDSEFLSYK